jgi:hypothetical protein
MLVEGHFRSAATAASARSLRGYRLANQIQKWYFSAFLITFFILSDVVSVTSFPAQPATVASNAGRQHSTAVRNAPNLIVKGSHGFAQDSCLSQA